MNVDFSVFILDGPERSVPVILIDRRAESAVIRFLAESAVGVITDLRGVGGLFFSPDVHTVGEPDEAACTVFLE